MNQSQKTREGNKADGRRLGCGKSEGMKEMKEAHACIQPEREKIRNLTSIQQIHNCDRGARHRAKNSRRHKDNRIQLDVGELTV